KYGVCHTQRFKQLTLVETEYLLSGHHLNNASQHLGMHAITEFCTRIRKQGQVCHIKHHLLQGLVITVHIATAIHRVVAITNAGRMRQQLGNGDITITRTHFTQIRSEEHTSELQSRENLVCRLLLEKKNKL